MELTKLADLELTYVALEAVDYSVGDQHYGTMEGQRRSRQPVRVPRDRRRLTQPSSTLRPGQSFELPSVLGLSSVTQTAAHPAAANPSRVAATSTTEITDATVLSLRSAYCAMGSAARTSTADGTAIITAPVSALSIRVRTSRPYVAQPASSHPAEGDAADLRYGREHPDPPRLTVPDELLAALPGGSSDLHAAEVKRPS